VGDGLLMVLGRVLWAHRAAGAEAERREAQGTLVRCGQLVEQPDHYVLCPRWYKAAG
jgi:hypothetical protein